MTISISRAEILPSSTTVLIQSQSRDTCIRYNPVSSYEFAPRISFKPLLWIFLMILIAFSVLAIIMGDAIDYPLIRREGKKLKNNTIIDVLVETNDSDDVLNGDEYSGDEYDDINSTESEDRKHPPLEIDATTATNFSRVYEVGDGKQVNNSDKEGAGYMETIRWSATKPNSTIAALKSVTNTIESAFNKTITTITGQQRSQNMTAESHLPKSVSNNETTSNTSNSSGESTITESNYPITPSEDPETSILNASVISSRQSNETQDIMMSEHDEQSR